LETILAAKELSKSFGKFKAVNNLSFSIQSGDIYGFLGENGAGKSTTMRMLLGLIFQDTGSIYIKGAEFNNRSRHLLTHVGAVIERPDLYGYLSGWDNLRLFATISNKNIQQNRLHEVLEIVGLKGRERDKVKAYSQGMKQRLGIAIALVHSPDLLILDEPTNGLDPQGIAEMRQLILHLSRDHGKTILISSHLLYEIEQVATKMLIIHKGNKVVEGNVKDLLNPEQMIINLSLVPNSNIHSIISNSSWNQYLLQLHSDSISVKMNPELVPQLNKWLVENNIGVTGISSRHSLEEYFLSLTNDDNAKAGAI
jgi:ABC-type multidrug transport system ATPase subunit